MMKLVKSKYRIIALDVDGTLLNDRYELTSGTVESVRMAHDAGARIVLCTGRGPANAIPVLEQMKLDGVLITHNGAVTVETPSRRLLHQISFQVAELESLTVYCRERQVHFDVCTAWEMYAEGIGEEAKAMYAKFMLTPHIVPDVLRHAEPLVKFTLFGSEEQMDRVEADIPALELPPSLTAIRSGVHFIDVMPAAASKGEALKELAALWGVDRSAVVAMGNYYNDVDMIRFAGLGIAMDNSPEDVKKAADAVVPSNNEEGVRFALQRYVLS
ncbi:Cof-type HAD-IIB family hydrolase [Paenibacillus filicis]|uniref:Cof-type HAD-IIB family hydrolase n=1 Tax=Paenibacillus gyeongsangnamensis TaxID=3388067 RepID=A0ABT4Q5G7_9BACL|nr:Cof-type HAD-IIB family hydrolase [Paenibacillus filicis]MCZ8512115.1 Cof-type HAD-IIB family hydrolase [Paenibacillus filicis]